MIFHALFFIIVHSQTLTMKVKNVTQEIVNELVNIVKIWRERADEIIEKLEILIVEDILHEE